MSGSGTRNWNPPVPRSPCRTLKFRTILSSPQEAILVVVRVGDNLPLSIQPTHSHAVVATKNNHPVGTITGSNMGALVNCISEGFSFVATVIEIKAGQCVVEVHIVE